MNSHYILQLDPQAKFEWDRCILRNPLTGERPDLTTAIAKTVNNRAGSYLVKVNLEVEILESTNIPPKTVELTANQKKAIATDNRLVPLRGSQKYHKGITSEVPQGHNIRNQKY